ncbi:MAG: hypothetical protein EOO75_13315 [Myxococcales bacterium]|nr:MAG: hypothetical protein EOO75_13315 [Myxococcales bacterium]
MFNSDSPLYVVSFSLGNGSNHDRERVLLVLASMGLKNILPDRGTLASLPGMTAVGTPPASTTARELHNIIVEKTVNEGIKLDSLFVAQIAEQDICFFGPLYAPGR